MRLLISLLLFLCQPKYDPILWDIEASAAKSAASSSLPHQQQQQQPLPAFLQLLHASGLAFELFSSSGHSLNMSMVPALLPEYPHRFPSLSLSPSPSLSTGSGSGSGSVDLLTRLELFYFSSLPSTLKKHPRVEVRFSSKLPAPFFPQLQVRLRDLATINGSWRSGCFLQEKHDGNALGNK